MLLTSVPTASAAKRCSVAPRGTSYVVEIKRGNVTCSVAGRVLQSFFSGRGKLISPRNYPLDAKVWLVDGWSCQHGQEGAVGCTRGGTITKPTNWFTATQAGT